MVHAMLLLCDRMTSALDAIAAELSTKSAFQRDSTPFHIPMLGSLHHYSGAEVHKALQRVATRSSPIAGLFLRWELTRRTLRLLVDSSPELDALEGQLQARLPRGRTWRPHAVILGNIEGIEAEHHAAFLAAVENAFPIVDTSTFLGSHLAGPAELPPVTLGAHYEVADDEPENGPAARPPSAPKPRAARKLSTAAGAAKRGRAATSVAPMDVERRPGAIKKAHRGGIQNRGGRGGRGTNANQPRVNHNRSWVRAQDKA